MTLQQQYLILGGTGKTGRRVVERLQARNLPVRVGSRSGQPAFDWENRETWGPALAGVSAVYVAFQPDLAVPGALETIQALNKQAVASGVQRIVLLSGRGEEEAQRCEQAVQESGLEWTIIRASWFNQNFSEAFLVDSVIAGEVVLPVGDILEPFVDADDIADVALAALTEDGHVGQLYEVTGPRLLTFKEALAEIGKATGRDIEFIQVSAEDYSAALRAEGVPEDYLWLLNYLFTTVMDGRNAYLTDGVQRALGRSPKDFVEYVRETAAAGAWQVTAADHA